MRTTALLLAAVIAALFFAESYSAPTPSCNGGTVVKASKKSQASASNSALADSTSEEMETNTAAGSMKAKSSKSHSESSFNTANENFESLEISNGGASACDDTLPARKCGETDEVYYKRIFPVKECDKNTWSAFYKKVFKQYKGECDQKYVKRIDTMFTTVYPKMDCRTNIVYKEYIGHYISIKYIQQKGETVEAYCARTITKTKETEEEYKSKVAVLTLFIKSVDWKLIKIEYKSKTGFKIVKEKETSTSTGKSVDDSSCGCKKTITEEEVKKTYAQKSGESIEDYYKRILSQSGETKEYIKLVSTIRKIYRSLSVWYDIKYIHLTRKFYTALYAKECSETEQSYFTRIVTKESYETEEQWVKRVEILMTCFYSSPLWSEEKYFESHTRKVYTLIYKKGLKEDDTTYVKRITARIEKESDNCYTGRITLIKYIFKDLKVWYEVEKFPEIKNFYTLKYKLSAGETEDKLFTRIVAKEKFESDEQYAQRIECINVVYPDLKIFWDKTSYDKYDIKKAFLIIYKQKKNEDVGTYYKRITKQITKESDTVYSSRMERIQNTYAQLDVWYSVKYFSLCKKYYTLRYSKKTNECQDAYYKRLVAKEGSETTEVYGSRLYLIHSCTASESLWYEEKYYETLTKSYYSCFFKKGEKESCGAWLTRVVKLMPKESEDNAIKRIKLIKKSKTGCSCWTSDNLNKLKCDKTITEGYYKLIYKAFITSTTIKRMESHNESGSSKISSSASESEVSINNCN